MNEIEDGVFNVHLPSSGGTTFWNVLRSVYGEEAVLHFEKSRAEAVLSMSGEEGGSRSAGKAVIGGHIPYGDAKRLFPDHRYITFLREPVARSISVYSRRIRNGKWKPSASRGQDDILDFWEQASTNQGIRFYSTSQVEGKKAKPRKSAPSVIADEVMGVLTNEFAVFGITEQFDRSLFLMKELLGWPEVPNYDRLNIGGNKPVEISAEVRERLAEIFSVECEIYRRALEMFEERCEQIENPESLAEFERFKARQADRRTFLASRDETRNSDKSKISNRTGTESPAAKPLCVAASTAVLIDTDKGVRPCCRYGTRGIHHPDSLGIGKLGDNQSISEIMNGEVWRGVADDLSRGKIPKGCAACIAREKSTGFKFREFYDHPDWQKGITYLEINSTNVCTLQCRHCNHFFSNKWAKQRGKPVYQPDAELLVQSLRELDLSHLDRVCFKGGEPMVNSDVPAALAHLQEIGRLGEVAVNFTTNGSVINEEVKEILFHAKKSRFGISMDGVGDVQTYIRHGRSENEKIEAFVRAYAEVPRAEFGLQASIMIYNIFSLEEMEKWWSGLKERVPGSRIDPPTFQNLVLNPPELSVRCLSDETRARLADHYEAIDPEMYGTVIRTLRLPFAGAEVHAKFVRRTRKDDEIFGDSVLDVVPELGPEMVLQDSE